MKIGYSAINVRAEDIDTKPAFREAFKRRRCLIPLDGFHEWQKLGPKERQPYAIAAHGRRVDGDGGLGKPGDRPPVKPCAAPPSSPVRQTPSSPSCATECR
jgi:putative SOS response-associated peptidase YedK